MKTLGAVLLVAGVIMILFTGYDLITKDTLVEFGPIEITHEEQNPFYWHPITGLILTAVGGVILLMKKKK
ncbi:hypothetical protein E1176_17215 [Fulvivirga sp. RKSG066]|uniref:hypothetical protein n=1 Tax=Fulvivirga aurantia TaxID=2529383 RepID=UPI0012BB55C8|nr:hypothetical protein [Fulvivirga aurantia]MTI22775.1 hypothetical protein [Fulvivirga aurantia]